MTEPRRDRCTPVCESFESTFCPRCGRADRAKLNGVRLMGAVGVLNSSSPAIEEFWATGDPEVFSKRQGS